MQNDWTYIHNYRLQIIIIIIFFFDYFKLFLTNIADVLKKNPMMFFPWGILVPTVLLDLMVSALQQFVIIKIFINRHGVYNCNSNAFCMKVYMIIKTLLA